ncbi:ABC transporter ATP-binding protein [Chelatococcus asaccharovorans]|uniref:Peptide/nickel transport system ATP-binding protein n=1 Tax=Chelatococcus asaccharovorans TaxID=28210 RepID=A0A2V3UI03_9HYPH|nr:ATP-binding cassette domain-containing protein [Chelatococcus asaccharovorans]MBS7705699.1 ABC transporter ATP-binding protein [Chelatococcus asaccharovorans]PXW58718.1 peptide/nickel transport system ATP-binding protein [Chelatococcus asaccharovorans]
MTLAIADLSIRSRDATIVDRFCLDVPSGQITAILGETGSGKSLIANAVMGLLPPGLHASGSILMCGKTIDVTDRKSLEACWWQQTFLVPQEPHSALSPLLSAHDQVAELSSDGKRHAEARKALCRMGLALDHHCKRPDQLSGGMAQRVLASIAAQSAAPILVADEPTKGLDPSRRHDVGLLLQQLRNEGRTILMVTHDLELAHQIADVVVFFHKGRIVEKGSASVVLRAPQSSYGRRYVESDPSRWEEKQPLARRSPSVVRTRALAVGYPGQTLIAGLDLDFCQGEIVALLGPSGIGKSTLGRTLIGQSPPHGGKLEYWLDDAGPTSRADRRVQKLHQDPTRVFSPWQSIGASMRDLNRLPEGQAATRKLPELMERFGLSPKLLDRRPSAISGGEAQRLALCRILCLRPKFIIADEPTSRLDPPVQADVMTLLRRVADEDGVSILLITHDARLASAIADRSIGLVTTGHGPARPKWLKGVPDHASIAA